MMVWPYIFLSPKRSIWSWNGWVFVEVLGLCVHTYFAQRGILTLTSVSV
jgi:hypothetical protein